MDNVSALTCLQTSKGAGDHVQSLVQRGKKINLRKFHKFIQAGLEEEEFKEILEDLESVYDCYVESDMM